MRSSWIAVALMAALLVITPRTALVVHAQNLNFSGSAAYADVLKQMSFGARIPDSPALVATANYIRSNLTSNGWIVQFQNFTYYNQFLRRVVNGYNVVATLRGGLVGVNPLKIVLGAHYDTRPSADNPHSSLANTSLPVPGADDGASGVAVLLELGRVFGSEGWPGGLTMVFFDGEDSGNYTSPAGWIQGSKHYVDSLNITARGQIKTTIILDMVGYSNLTLRREDGSDFAISSSIWGDGQALGYSQFAPGIQASLVDDHRPFLDAGIRAVDIIDFNYPYWHTPLDTADKVSASSLEAVGRTLEDFITIGSIPNLSLPTNFFLVLGALIAASGAAILTLLKARKTRLRPNLGS